MVGYENLLNLLHNYKRCLQSGAPEARDLLGERSLVTSSEGLLVGSTV